MMISQSINLVRKIKQRKPLILNLTNAVTMDFVANGLLSLGASPIMSEAIQELDDLIDLAQIVVINLGTLNSDFINRCQYACRIANLKNKPVVLDPVGAGASVYRTEISQQFISNYAVAIIRGNASEIAALSGACIKTKGVDTTVESVDVLHDAQALAQNRVVVISGATDIVLGREKITHCVGGSDLMPQVTGTGCLLSSVIGAFHAIEPDAFLASVAAVNFYNHCGEIAARASGPGSFKVNFLDALYWVSTDI
jgi:hydroxyethylthiazole kinase